MSTIAAFDLALLEQAPGFVAFLRGPDHVFEVANAKYYEAVGHRDLIGKGIRDALPEIAASGLYEVLDRVFATGEPFVGRGVELLLQRVPGAPPEATVVDFVYQPIREGGGAMVGILVQGHETTDATLVTEQRAHAQALLQASEQRYRTLFQSIDDGYCLMQMLHDATGKTVDYRFLETNAAFESQTGLVNAVGKRVRELVPALDESWFQIYGEVADTGIAKRFENHAPAMARWFDVYANRVGAPALKQVALVFKDVTARKDAEQTAARALEAEQRARKEAEAAAHMRDEFLATVSHELRTPLASMLGWVQLLRTESLPPEKQARALETIERNARAQAQLIEDLLDVSRIIAGQLRIESAPLELATVIQSAIETVRPAALARDIDLVATLEAGVTVLGDASRLQQVVWNLLTNAVKFTSPGGSVRVLMDASDTSVEILVVDTGKGIPATLQPFVFDRFRQADGATTRSSGGLGLGLSIVRELVTMHGGSVAVASEGVGKGSTFTVTLPRAASRASSEPPREPPPMMMATELVCPPELAGMRLLIVEDETDTREMLEAMFARCGATTELAATADAGFAALQARPPDLLLSDIGLPGEDGYSLIQRIRALPADRGGHLPAVALTAYARIEDRAKALRAGFDNHVAKPVEPAELLAVVASFARRAARGQR